MSTINSIYTSQLTNGQLYIGSTGNEPASANLTGGTNIGITNSPGGISIAALGFGSITWQTVTTSQVISKFTGYIIQNTTGPLNFLFNNTSGYNAVGDIYFITSLGITGGFGVQCASGGPLIYYGSTSGTTLTTSNITASICMLCASVGGSGLIYTVLGQPTGTFILA